MKKTIRTELVLAVIITVSVTFLVGGICSSMYFFSILKEQTVHDEEEQLYKTAKQLEYIQDEVISIAKQIAIDRELYDLIYENRNTDTFTELLNYDKGKRALASYISLNAYLHSATIVTPDKMVFSSNLTENFYQEIWYTDFKQKEVGKGFSKPHTYISEQGTQEIEVMSYIMTFRDSLKGKGSMGDIIINVDFMEIVKNAKMDQSLLEGYALYDQWGNRILGEGIMTPIFEDIKNYKGNQIVLDNGNTILVNRNFKENWIMVSEVSKRLLMKKLKYIYIFFCVIFSFALGILSFTLYQFIKKLTRPIEQLHKASIEVGKGNFDVVVDIQTNDELSILGDTFNTMVQDLQKLISESIEYEKTTKKMEINRLMLQINPHFICNTLNSIVYMAQMGEDKNIIKFTNAFISLLQDTLTVVEDNIFISLKQELRNIENYLTLQKYRYPDEFDVIYNYKEDILECAVPNVFIQPIVENAIFHGLGNRMEKGLLEICITKCENNVEIMIRDNGVGMSKAFVRELLTDDAAVSGKMRTIGVANVKKRIEHIYGIDYGMTIMSEKGVGTTVMMVIPYQKYNVHGLNAE